MTFVVGEDCINCKHTDCVEVCPVDCFYEGPNFLVIHPDECIDCALCEPECPVDAIFSEDELPEDQQIFLELNAELAEVWPCITEMKEALPDADITVRGNEVHLSGPGASVAATLFEELVVLAERGQRVDDRTLDRTIDNQVSRLRRKIEPDILRPRIIRTIRNEGYCLSCDVEVIE